MNLLFVAQRYWPAVGGLESFLRHLARGLGERHDVTVLALTIGDEPSTRLFESLRPPTSFEPFLDGPVRVEPLRLSPLRRRLLAPQVLQVLPGPRRYAFGRMRFALAAHYSQIVAPVIARTAVERRADLLHAWGAGLLLPASIRAARLARVPSAVMASVTKEWACDRVSGAAYRRAGAVVAQLESEASAYRALGVPEKQIALCGACSPGVPSGHGEELRQQLGLRGPLVLFLGVRRPPKGVDILLEAASLVARQRSDVTFAVVGPGPAAASTNGARVLDVGGVVDPERAGWLEAADLLCLPSAYESFGIILLEAWSVGTPVLVSDIPPLAELAAVSGGGVSVPREPDALAREMLDLLSDPARLRALGERGRAFWQNNYTVEAVASRHERLYQSLLSREVA